VNAHSHAFQRALRGRVERVDAAHKNDDFWAWRDTMYRDAARVTVDDVQSLAAWAYAEMLEAGYIAVAEFHYLHHDIGGVAFGDAEMSRAIVRAAREVGISLTLLETAYLRGGHDRALQPAQQRFAFPDAAAFLDHVRRSRDVTAAQGARTGVAIHSVRACARDAIERISTFARDENLVLHVHACEQRRELEECQREHGMTPIALLDASGALGPHATVVHATHLTDDDIALLAKSGARVCLTPSTERNLGDGMCRIADLSRAGVPLCIGSDSHARIDAVDELRSVEDHERLRLERRNVLVAPGARLAHALVPIGTRNGAGALGADVASRIVVRLPVEGATGDAEVGLDAWLVGGSSRDVLDVDVEGRAVVREGVLVSADRVHLRAQAVAVLKRLAR
jgi:formimidoylglutamate deiminase